MTSRRRIPNRAVRVVALVAGFAAACALAQPSSAAVFRDPAGDSGAAPDVTALTVTNDAAGRISFRVTLANRPNGLQTTDAGHDLIYVFLDADRNARTGDVDGDDFSLQLFGQGFGIARWQGSAFAAATVSRARVTRAGATLALTVPKGELGGTRAFSLSVVSVRITGGAIGAIQGGETGPDTGRWSYTLATFCVVPKLAGKTLAAARRSLQAAGCAVGTVRRRASASPSGRVVGQSPRAGTTRPRRAKVNLVVSRGKAP